VVVDVNTSLGSCKITDQTQNCTIYEVIIFMLVVKLNLLFYSKIKMKFTQQLIISAYTNIHVSFTLFGRNNHLL